MEMKIKLRGSASPREIKSLESPCLGLGVPIKAVKQKHF